MSVKIKMIAVANPTQTKYPTANRLILKMMMNHVLGMYCAMVEPKPLSRTYSVVRNKKVALNVQKPEITPKQCKVVLEVKHTMQTI